MPANIKDVDSKKGIVTGYCSSFNVIDDAKDVVEPGAFLRTINAWGPSGKNRIKNLFQHDPAWLVGRPLVLREDHFGLYHETKISQTSMGKDVLTLIEDGVITEQSIGYDVIVKQEEEDLRKLKELRLWEYSWVTWGCNEDTPILGVKGLNNETDIDALLERMARFEKALKNGHFNTDEVPEMIELALKGWQIELKRLETKQTKPPGKDVIVLDDKGVQTPFELKVRDFNEISTRDELRNRGYRLMDAMYWAFDEIRWEHGKDDNVAELLATSIDQFKAAMVEWATEAQKEGVFYASPTALAELTETELKAIFPGLFAFVDKIKTLSLTVDPANATPPNGDSSNSPDDTGDLSQELKELTAPLTGLKKELQSKALLTELREFGKSLRSDN